MFNYFSDYTTTSVKIGNVFIGGSHPICIQSMTNTSTANILHTVNQIIELANAGCQIVRIAASNMADVTNIESIKNNLRESGLLTPLIADVHFNANIANEVSRVVEKVRINPGNFVVPLPNESAEDELIRTEEKFLKLLHYCKQNNTALRIGVNHGSLSKRILHQYGNTPLGLVHSVMEFVRWCYKYDFHDVVLSIKSSDPQIMIVSNLLLIKHLIHNKIHYPIHLGVTEAGNEWEGRIKSTVGIGTLLMLGIGDTIRVSLTENPVYEVPFAAELKRLISRFPKVDVPLHFDEFRTHISDFELYAVASPDQINEISHLKPDYYIHALDSEFQTHTQVFNTYALSTQSRKPGDLIVYHLDEFNIDDHSFTLKTEDILCIKSTFKAENFTSQLNLLAKKLDLYSTTMNDRNIVIWPIFDEQLNETNIIVKTLVYKFLSLFKSIKGLVIYNSQKDGINEERAEINRTILQACGIRKFKTEFTACPSCNRTKFNIEKIFSQIKKELSHFPDIHIAVMGCIVNGPGEMNNADYGYVGAGTGLITLYKEGRVVKTSIPESMALDELKTLIFKDKNKFI